MWGSFSAPIDDQRDHTIEVGAYLFRGDAERFHPLFMSPSIAPFISLWIIAEIVGDSVHLDRDGGSLAVEIEHERAKWMLPPEFQSSGAQPEYSPQPDFSRAHAFAMLTCSVD